MNPLQEKSSVLELKRQEVAEDLASFVKRLGNPVSTILLHTPCSIFCIPHIEGIIGYQVFNDCAVIIGDPICLPENIEELTEAFHLHCQQRNLKIIYLLASDTFAHWAVKNRCQTLIQVGEKLVIDPTRFKLKQKLRWKINQARQRGVLIKEYKDSDQFLEKQIRGLTETWLKGKHGPQIHLGDLDFFLSNDESRIFYAVHNDKIVGALKLSPIDRSNGWVLNYYLADLNAPVGTTEHLINFTFETLSKEKCRFLCLGVIAGTKFGEVIGLGLLARLITHLIFKISRWLFKLDAKKTYLYKYNPKLSPTYILFSEKITLSQLLAIKRVFNVEF